jgi:stearoyl-CoA desaturase (delta-9 desaturase)
MIHALALLALVPALFSWTGVILALVGLYVFGTLGINVCYHRLLAHQSFRCPTWLERGLALLGVCCLQDSPARWVAIHRYHHQFSDEEKDPHSPLVNFCWSHFGWVFVHNREFNALSLYDRYSRDLMRQRFYFRLEKNVAWAWVYLIHAALFYVAGMLIGWLSAGDVMEGTMFGLSLLVWGVLVRTVLVWHVTWSVNSLTHMFGYQSFATGENSRNNWLVGVITNGEGWHNNHHAHPRSAAHGLRWWELDVTYRTIRLLKLVGLAWDISLPRHREGDVEEPMPEPEHVLISASETAGDK